MHRKKSQPSPKFSVPAARSKSACRRATSTGHRNWRWRNWWRRRSREKRHVIVEAGTGTGKTLAYLIPAIRSGRRVVISTATKSLQEQLSKRTFRFIQKHFAPGLKVAVMKGRGNFLCREKVYRMAGQPVLKGLDELDWFQQIRDWEKVTETGDRAELNFLPDDSDLWQRLDARRDACSGQKCPEFNKLFYYGDAPARRRSRPDHRESSSVFRRPRAEAG